MQAALIGLDWGTTRLRGYLLTADGEVLDRRDAPLGIQSVPAGGYREVFERFCEPWLRDQPRLPAIAAGMVGSRDGWREAPYVPLPATPVALGRACLRIDDIAARPFAIVPGIVRDAIKVEPPDVMRGEETKLLGLLEHDAPSRALVVMPGTHCKWAIVEGGAVTSFTTYMTGDVFGAIATHTILARTLPASQGDEDASIGPSPGFVLGLARSSSNGHALLHDLFTVRTLALFDRLPESERRDYLSGLLVGEELREGLARVGTASRERVVLVGDRAHVARYRAAFRHFDVEATVAPDDIVARGLAAIARTLPLR